PVSGRPLGYLPLCIRADRHLGLTLPSPCVRVTHCFISPCLVIDVPFGHYDYFPRPPCAGTSRRCSTSSLQPPKWRSRDASLQFVRKLSGFNVPSKANEAAFERAIEEVAASARALIQSLVTTAEPRNREVEAARARAKAAARFGVHQ